MTSKKTTTTGKLNKLYKKRAFLKTKLTLQIETSNRTHLDMHKLAEIDTFKELDANQAEIDILLDKGQ